MKKVLLLSAAMMSMSLAATAQETVKATFSNARSMMKETKVAPIAAIACDGKYDAASSKASRRTIANGVSYGRPEGTYYVSNLSYQFLYVPAFIDATYKNYATDKASATWQYGLAPDMYPLQGDENNDLTVSWPLLPRNYAYPQFVPTLSVGENSYQFGEELGVQTYLINGDSILSVTQVNLAGGAYTGFSDGTVFGSGDREFSMDGGQTTVTCKRSTIYEFFSKPIVPFCLNQIEFPVVSYSKSEMIPAGTTMHLYIVKMTEDGMFTDEVTVLPFTKDDIEDFEVENGRSYGFISLSNKTYDGFGTEITEPIIIDYPFAIVIDGFAQPGVDFSLYMCNVMATERDYYEVEGGIEGTCCEYVRADNGEPIEGLYYCQTISKTDPEVAAYARQYNALIYLTGMFDVVRLEEGFDQMTAPVEGGYIYAEFEDDDNYYPLQYYTTCPRLSDWDGIEGEENYWLVDMPDWLTVKEYVDDWFEDYNVTMVEIEAAPLPAGVEGRTAQIRLVSAKGADSGVITVTQGNASTGISSAVTNSAKTTGNASVYNLAGQSVDNSFKGLIIKNGKKYIAK